MGALLGLKTPLIGLFSDVCAKYHCVCHYSAFFMVANSNLQVPILKTLSFTRFWDMFRVPWGLLGLKLPQNAIFSKMTFFGAYILIDLLNLTFLKFREICSYMYAV